MNPKSKRVIAVYFNCSHSINFPEAIAHLPCLETLGLSENYFKELPDVWDKLPRLSKLDLSSNFLLESVSDSLFELSKRNFATKYERQGVCASEAPVLGLLEILCGYELQRYVDVYKKVPRVHLKKSRFFGTMVPEPELCALKIELGGAKHFRELTHKNEKGEFLDQEIYGMDENGIIRGLFGV